jgi:hypothetical protein
MRKILLALILTLIVPQAAKAEEFTYQKAYQDYQYNYSLYSRAHDDYVLARARYLQYQTLVSEEEAKKATLAMLGSRDEVVRNLLTAVRMRLKENQGLVDSEKESLFKRIDPEVKFYEEHKVKLNSAGTLADFVQDSEEAKDRYASLTEQVIYSSLVYQSIGKTAGERVKLERTIADLKAKVLEIKAAGDKDVSFLDRFFVDIENKLLRSRDKETQAKETIFAAEKSFRTKVDDYQNAIAEVQGSYLYLKEIASYLQEVLRLIKTK